MATADRNHEVEFHEAFASAIPLLIEQLEDEDRDIRRGTVEVMVKLANHGEGSEEALRYN